MRSEAALFLPDSGEEILPPHGTAEIKSLNAVALLRPQYGQLMQGFDALADHPQAQRMPAQDDGPHQSRIMRVMGNIANNALIDFEAANRRAPELVNPIQIGPHSINRQGDAHIGKPQQICRATVPAVQQNALGELQFQIPS